MASALDLKDRGAQSLKETLKAYTEEGHEVFFVTYKKHLKDPNYFYERSQKTDFKDFHYYGLVLPFSFLMGFPVLRRVVTSIVYPIVVALKFREITHGDVDVLYGYEVNGVLACALIRMFHKRPMVSRFQGTILQPLLNKKLMWVKYLDHVLALRYPANLVIMTNDGTFGDRVLRRLGSDMSRVCLWLNGVPKGLHDPRYKDWIRSKYGLRKSTKILLTLSRLVNWKRIDRAILTLKYVSDRKDATLVVVGDGPERENLRYLVKAEGLADRVIFAGSIPHLEIKKFLNSCDVFLSLYDLSNLGNPVMEAMSCGKCVVALDRGEMGDIIENNRNGILVKFQRRGSLGPVVVGLLEDRKKMGIIGKEAFSKSKEFWSWEERMAAEIEEVEKIL